MSARHDPAVYTVVRVGGGVFQVRRRGAVVVTTRSRRAAERVLAALKDPLVASAYERGAARRRLRGTR